MVIFVFSTKSILFWKISCIFAGGCRGSMLSVAASLRGCAAYSGLVAKSDKEITAQMYKEMLDLWENF